MSTLQQLMERFSQRMQEIQNKGGSIATDPAILSMHQDLTAMHLKLLEQVDEAQESHGNHQPLPTLPNLLSHSCAGQDITQAGGSQRSSRYLGYDEA